MPSADPRITRSKFLVWVAIMWFPAVVVFVNAVLMIAQALK